MKKIIFYFVILVLSVWVGVKIYQHPGYLLISYQNWAVETTFWFAVLFLVAFLFLSYFLIRLIKNILNASDFFQKWWQKRTHRKELKLLRLGILQLWQGSWNKSEKLSYKSAKLNKGSLVGYFNAAKAASLQNADDRMDFYMDAALKKNKDANFAIECARAELKLQEKKYEDSLNILLNLQKKYSHSQYLLKLLAENYLATNDFESLHKILPEIYKRQVFSDNNYRQLEKKVYLELLAKSFFGDGQSLKRFWNNVPKYLHEDSDVVAMYARKLMSFDQDYEAEELLRYRLKKKWDDQLLDIYSTTEAKDSAKQLAFVEQKLKSHENNANLLRALGIISLRNKLWGQAKGYLENSLRRQATPETYLGLGYVMERLGEPHLALHYYKKGLSLNTQDFLDRILRN